MQYGQRSARARCRVRLAAPWCAAALLDLAPVSLLCASDPERPVGSQLPDPLSLPEVARIAREQRNEIAAVATVVPDERRISHAHTRVNGWIEELFIATVGEPVRAGQPLAAIFSQDLYASQLEYLAALSLADQGPRSAVLESARARLSVLGMTEAEIAAVERDGRARRLVTVAAPHDGIVLRRSVSVGTAVDPEDGVLVGYVFADVDAERDLGGWVRDARRVVADAFFLPSGYRLEWTGQYEYLADVQARLRVILPLTLLLIIGLLYLALRGVGQTLLVLFSVPFAVVGSVWLLSALQYNLSTAVWVGLIAVVGVATRTAIVIVVYLDQALARSKAENRLRTVADVDTAIIDGATRGARPMVMTVATTVLGLMPLLWEGRVGADLSARTAAPVVGGMLSCLLLTLLVLPGGYAIWRRYQWQRGTLLAELRAAARADST